MFKNLLEVRPARPIRGLDFRQIDTGDGAALGVISVVGTLIIALAFWAEFHFEPAPWVHAILWPAVTIPRAVLLMRPPEAAPVAQQYRHRSAEMGL